MESAGVRRLRREEVEISSGRAAGRPDAGKYEYAVEAILSALFYPSLAQPQVQHRLHGGRKRIDITYANIAKFGFFSWVSTHFAAPYIFVECKNYASDPANPEIDQLSGRFSPQRGQVGILVCRQIVDRELLYQRCKDTAGDQRGYILCLDDDDLAALVDAVEDDGPFAILQNQFERLLMNS